MRSIRRQLNGTLIAAIALIEGIGMAGTYLVLRHSLTEQIDASLLTKAEAISTLVLREEERIRVNFSDRFLRGFDEDEATDFFELWGSGGAVLARSDTLRGFELPRTLGTFQKPKYWNLRLPDHQRGRAIGFEFTPRTVTRGKTSESAAAPPQRLQLVVASNREELDESLHHVFAVTVSAGVLILGATALIVPYALRRGLRSLDALGQQAARIQARSLDVRFASSELPSELVPITQRLNDLLGRLQSSFERERRVSADLAHELRTPLAELRMIAESALKWPDARDPTTDRETLAVAKQMEQIVQHMLTLARMEGGQVALQRETIDLPLATTAAWRPFAARAAEKNLRVKFKLQPYSIVDDAALWRSILANLYDNAVEYTPAGGAVTVECSVAEGLVHVSVTNTTEGLQAKDVGALFERFWRKENARSGGNHLGLGLSLVKSFAQAMGWGATARLNERSALTICLSKASESSVQSVA